MSDRPRGKSPTLLGVGPISDSRGALVINTAALAYELTKTATRESRNFDELQQRLFATIKVVKRGAGSGDTDKQER
jgi:hypothetical protein